MIGYILLIFLRRIILKIKNDEKILIFIFIVISIFSLIISVYLTESYEIEYLSQGYYSNNVKYFYCLNKDDFNITNIYKNQEDIIIFKELSINNDIRGIYYKRSIKKPNMKSGRFFQETDFDENKHYAVIGSNFTEGLVEQHNIKYVIYDGIKYQVIGTMGYNRESKIDRACFINLNNSLCAKDGAFAIDSTSKNKVNKMLETIQNRYSINLIDREKNGIDRFFKTECFNIILIILVLCILVLTTVSVSLYWVEKRKRKIAILRLVGYNDKRIIKVIFFRYLFLEHISILIGFLVGNIIIISQNYNISGIIWNILIFSYVLVNLTCIAIVITPIRKALKLDINSLLRCKI